MKSTYDPNLKVMVYGVATDGADWIICSFDGDKTFEISYPIHMMDRINESNWSTGEGADLVKILHTLFDRQIRRVLKQPDEDDEEMETAHGDLATSELVDDQRDRDRKAIEAAASATATWVANLVPGDLSGLEEQM